MQEAGAAPCLASTASKPTLVEHFSQAWKLGTLAAKVLAQRFVADPGAADWRRFGRLPGFTNRKPTHRNSAGLFPFTRLHSTDTQPFPEAPKFYKDLLACFERQEAERREARQRYAGRPLQTSAHLALARFRSAPRHAGQPVAADLAFAIAACAHGWPEQDIAAELAANYLSRDPDQDGAKHTPEERSTKAVR